MFTNSHGTKGIGVVFVRALLLVLTQSAAMGALPLLYAATSAEARGGGYYGPGGFRGLWGQPTDAVIAPHAKDESVARRLWAISEELTGVVAPSFVPLHEVE